jgi:uncharacterized protein YjbI with pentapeptide repeats
MDDTTRTALDAETPVNPYSLLDALNTAAARTNAVWLLFLGLMGYLALAAGAVTHRDLLLDAGIALPLLQARIDLTRFFVGAPALLALAHVALIAQFVLLARKATEFHNAVRLLESTDLRSHPLRLEADSFFHVQALAGPERSRVVGALLYGLGWLTLLLLPLALLVYLQLAFLPFHNATATAVQAGIVLADIAVVLLVGVFLLRGETSFFRALLRMLLSNPGSAAFGLATAAGAAFVAVAAAAPLQPGAGSSAVGAGAPLLGLFPRHLELADAGLVSDKALIGGRTISLRGRDLRFARLDRADLRQADLTGARLDGASLAGADLRGARLGCADAAALPQPVNRASAGCTSARRADFRGAHMAGAILAGADLSGARFDEASLERADLSRALMAGATFERARLQRASLASGSLQAASLRQADLQGAVLTGARLEMADLSGAGLQGASLAGAHLAGAVLREADLEGAGLQKARLYGADLRGARLKAADLASAMVWRAVPPAADAASLADIANIAMKAPAAVDLEALKATLASVESGVIGPTAERTAGLKALLAAPADGGWEGSADGQAWATLLRASEAAMAEGFKTRLAEHLARLACRSRFANWVAAAVVGRAVGTGFKGDPAILHERLKAADCAAAHTVPRAALLDLAVAAEAAKAAAVTPPLPPSGAVQGQ